MCVGTKSIRNKRKSQQTKIETNETAGRDEGPEPRDRFRPGPVDARAAPQPPEPVGLFAIERMGRSVGVLEGRGILEHRIDLESVGPDHLPPVRNPHDDEVGAKACRRRCAALPVPKERSVGAPVLRRRGHAAFGHDARQVVRLPGATPEKDRVADDHLPGVLANLPADGPKVRLEIAVDIESVWIASKNPGRDCSTSI